MNFKRILVLVMALVMIVSACAPAIHATADAVSHDHSTEETKNELNYVSLGDAMANGFGLDCYGDSKVVTNGFLELSHESYPAQFAAWLAGLKDGGDYLHSNNTPQYYYYGDKANVTLMQLATQGVRVEDLLAILQADPNALVENGLDSLGSTADLWISHKLDDKMSDKLWLAYVASTYQSAVRDADIISLGVGNANFDSFLLDRLMPVVGLGTDAELQNELKTYGYMTLEAALELVELDAEMTDLVNKVYNKFNAKLVSMGLPTERVNVICDRVAYTVASYVASYSDVLDLIVELNPDVELVIVPMINNVTNFAFDVVYNGRTIKLDAGDLLSIIYDALNAYIAGVPTSKQLQGEYEDAKFYYAELSDDVKVEMLGISEIDIYDEALVNGVQSFIFSLIFGDLEGSVSFTSDEVKAFVDAKNKGQIEFADYVMATDAAKVELIAAYLGVAEVVLDAMKKTPVFNVDEILASMRNEGGIASLVGADDLDLSKVMDEDAIKNAFGDDSDLITYLRENYTSLSKDEIEEKVPVIASAWVAPTILADTLSSIDALNAVFYVYGNLVVAENVFGTPSANGHKVLGEAVINSYKNDYTVQDETIENIKESLIIIAGLVAQYYDEAYVYGYEYADANGYIDKVVTLIDRVINRINRVDLSDNTMTDDFRADLEVELDAIVKTLNEIKIAIKTDKAKDVPGLVATLRALKDDVLTHVANIYALCEQAGIDVNQLVIIPALYEILEIIETQVIPAIVETVETMVEKAVEHITEKIEEIYGEIEPILAASKEILSEVIRLVLEIHSGAENALELAEKVYNVIYNFLVENGDDIVYAAKVAARVYIALVQFIVENQEEIEDALEIAGKAFKFMLKVGAYIYVNKDDIVAFATNVYTTIVNFLVENEEEIEEALRIAGIAFDFIVEAAKFVYENKEEIYELATKVYAEILRTIDRVHGLVDSALDLYDYAIEVLIDVFGSVENALICAEKIYNRLVKLAIQYKNELDAFAGDVYSLYEEILAIIVDTYNTTQDAIETATLTAKMLHKRLIQTVVAMNVAIEDAMYNASNGSYELKDDSYYVALGNSDYVEELAAMLNLSEKFSQFTVNENYADVVAGADLITIKVNNGEFYEFAYTQIMGTLANIVRSNEDLIGWCNNPWVGDAVLETIESYGIDLDAETIELEWSKYLSADDIEMLNTLLARLKAELVEQGLPETLEIDVTSEIEGILEAEGLMLDGISVTVEPVVINVADLAIYAIENVLYSYVQFIERTAVLLENVRALSPDATVVITHVANPLDLMPFDLSGFVPNFDKCEKVLNTAVGALNGYLYGLALVNENTIFVDSEDAQDIYDALHVYCDHVYDDPCLDTDCNRCGEVRVAPGHSFTHYVNNNDQTCTKDGTATAKCDRCDVTDTVTVKGSAKGHKWQDATCTTPKKCSNCGEVSGKALGHKYDNSCDTECNRCGYERAITHKFGEWEVTKKPTLFKDGEQTRTCSICGYSETKPYVPESDVDVITLVALAVGSIIVAFGASTAIILLIQKKKEG